MIRFRYQPTFEHFAALNRMVLLRQFRGLIIISGILAVVYLIQPLAVRATDQGEGGWEVYRSRLGLLILPGIMAYIVVATKMAVRKRWNAAEEIRVEREYEIDDAGVKVTGSSLSGFLDWRHFTEAKNQGGYFLLKTAQNQFHYFPVSAVPDADALSVLLAQKVVETKQRSSVMRRWAVFWVWLAIIFAIVLLYLFNPSNT